MNILEFLRTGNANPERTAQFKHTRFSELAGEDMVFTIRGLGFDQLEEIHENHPNGDSDLFIILDGMVEPNLRDAELLKKYHAAGYDEVVKAIFQPGEISRIARQIMALSGYRADCVEELKKK